jgi:hypothetical protein
MSIPLSVLLRMFIVCYCRSFPVPYCWQDASFVVEACLYYCRTSWLKSAKQDKVLQQRADPWGPLWSKSAARDKILQWGADPWGPLWLSSTAWDKIFQQGTDPLGPSLSKSAAWDKVLQQGQIFETLCGWSPLNLGHWTYQTQRKKKKK